ncbi:amino acid ABC transporter membrane protein [Lawsonibacter asaccharolyticus]|jgi:His/Glu/Gln/Arg/opine family amino acid ABC transporter permease subunit|nr:amino acid ABC transporter membrane protein [Lawsonibacter asaccharolyticus]
MDLAYYYELWRGMMLSADPAVADAVAWWQEFYVKFYMAFIEADRWKQYLDGIGTTLTATALALVLGVVLGILVALVRTAHDQQRADRRRNPVLGLFNGVCKVYVTVIRGTPMMVQLLIWSSVVFVSSRNFTQIGILGLGINSGAYVAEIIRGGLMAVDGGQMEAGRSLGLNYFDTMRFIVIPQAIKAILPALGNEFIILLKDTSLITVIGGKELLHAAQGIMGRTYEAMFPLIGIACMYLVLVMIFTWLLGKLERRLRQSDRR